MMDLGLWTIVVVRKMRVCRFKSGNLVVCVRAARNGERVSGDLVCILKESMVVEKRQLYKGVNVILFGAIKETNA